MKKTLAILLVIIMLCAALAGCGGQDVNTDPVGGLSEEQAAMLEGFGISMEEFNSMSSEEQQAILDELGIVMEDQKQTESTSGSKKEYTTADVAAGGKYKVRIGDGHLNNYWLYYENGQLVKVETSFRKSSEEEPEEDTFEGDTLKDFWYIDKSLDELIDFFDERDYGYTHTITPID